MKKYINMLVEASKKGIKKEVELLELNTLEEYRNYLKNEFNAEIIFGE